MLFSVLAIGIAYRILGITGDLWLDEIWSIRLVEASGSIYDIIFNLHHDNNHILNSLYIYLIGAGHANLLYRLLSLGASILTILAFLKLNLSRSRAATLIATFILATSYPMMLYATEARGYSTMLLGLTAAIIAGQKLIKRPSDNGVALLLIAGSLVALISHFSAIIYMIAIIIWLSTEMIAQKIQLSQVFRLLVGPISLIIGFTYIAIFLLEPGSGSSYFLDLVWLQAFGTTFGAPLITPLRLENMPLAVITPAITINLLMLVELYFLYRARDKRVILFVLGVFILPPLAVAIMDPKVLYERYFLGAMFLSIILIANFLSRLSERNVLGKSIAIIFIGLIAFSNGLYAYSFSYGKRGHYRSAIEFIVENSKNNQISLSSDHEFRNPLVLNYYAQKLSTPVKLLWTTNNSKPQWFIKHTQDPDHIFAPNISLNNGKVNYKLKANFPFTALSGWAEGIYLRQ